jgi:phosphatidylcholine synthase
MNLRRVLAVGVHVYTALGVVLAFVACLALLDRDAPLFLSMLWLAGLIDATDGTLARRVEVKRVIPGFDGARLDDIVDYITYAFLPSVGLVVFGVLPGALAWVAVLPALASAYGFCQQNAKTDESFVGFPSYWNLVFLYLYVLSIPAIGSAALLVVLSLLVFVPFEYIYPSRTRWLMATTIGLGAIYGPVLAALCLYPRADWAPTVAWLSLLYPLYYAVISAIYTWRARAR